MANTIEDDDIYSYEVLLEKDLEEVARLLARTFTEGNALEIYLKTVYEQFYPYALAVSKAILQDQLSIIAVHKQTREIHGIVQAADAKTMAKQNFEDVDPSIDTLRVLQEIEEHFMNQYGEFNDNDLVQILMVGIRQDCSGKGEIEIDFSIGITFLRLHRTCDETPRDSVRSLSSTCFSTCFC